jgi:hypothetical protein
MECWKFPNLSCQYHQDQYREVINQNSIKLSIYFLDLTTVEGILQSVKQDLEETQSQRRLIDPETAEKLDHFIRRIDQCLSLEIPWTLVKTINLI